MPTVTGPEARRLYDALIDEHDPRIARAIRRVLNALRTRVDQDAIAAVIRQGDIRQLERLLTLHRAWTEVDDLFITLSRAAHAGAETAAAIQGPLPAFGGDSVEIHVGKANPWLTTFSETITSTKVREINTVSMLNMRQVLTRANQEGVDPYESARRIRASLGLTRYQENVVHRYRRELETNNANALQRNLRDERFDGPIRRAINNEEPLDRETIDRYVERYRQRWVKYRSEVIGRTEAIRAVQGAQYLLWEQMIAQGRIHRQQIRRHWIATHDDKLRHSHREIPILNPDGVGQTEMFQSPLGPILYPGWQGSVPENNIQCRCAAFVEIVSPELLGLDDPPIPTEGVNIPPNVV